MNDFKLSQELILFLFIPKTPKPLLYEIYKNYLKMESNNQIEGINNGLNDNNEND
jgi:hypothetical protein